MRASVALMAVAAATTTVVAGLATTPRFTDYEVALAFSGRPAPVDLASAHNARRFRTRLREGANEGPNFADHFTIVTWGCGTDCHILAVVDAKTGAVFFAGGFDVDVSFRRDSRLVILNPIEAIKERWGDPVDCSEGLVPRTVYLEWTGKLFRTLATTDTCQRQSNSALEPAGEKPPAAQR